MKGIHMDDNNQTQQNQTQEDQSTSQDTQQIIRPPEPEVPDFDSQAPLANKAGKAEETEFSEKSQPESDSKDGQSDSSIDEQLANMSNEEVVASFAEGLLIEKNFGEMDEETKKDMVNDIIERVNNFINRAVLESLPKEKLDELDAMIENDTASPEAVAQLIQDSGVDAGAVSVEAMAKFREIYLGADKKQEA